MVLRKLLRSPTTRLMTVGSLVVRAKRALNEGSRLRALALFGVAALAWKWAVVGLAAQGLVRLLRGQDGPRPAGQ